MASHADTGTPTELRHSDPDNPSIDDIGDHARGHDAVDEVDSDHVVVRRRGQKLVGQMGEGLGVPVGLGQEPE